MLARSSGLVSVKFSVVQHTSYYIYISCHVVLSIARRNLFELFLVLAAKRRTSVVSTLFIYVSAQHF